jgi:coatomer subunit beta'
MMSILLSFPKLSFLLMVTHKKNCLNRGIYPPAEEYMNHAERSSESLVEAFKNMHVHEEALPDDIEDAVDEVVEDGGVEESQEDAVEVDAEDAEVEESQDDAVEVEAEGSTDGAVLVNGNSSEEQWGTKNEEPSA